MLSNTSRILPTENQYVTETLPWVYFYLIKLLKQSCETLFHGLLEAGWNVMAHAQKPDFVFWRNGRIHLNRRGASVQSTAGSRGVRISGSNAGYTMFRDSVKGTGYPLYSPFSPSLPLPCITVCHHISTGVYLSFTLILQKQWDKNHL